jgi:hypothetical protein
MVSVGVMIAPSVIAATPPDNTDYESWVARRAG